MKKKKSRSAPPLFAAILLSLAAILILVSGNSPYPEETPPSPENPVPSEAPSPTPLPTPSPAPEPEPPTPEPDPVELRAKEIIAGMTPEQKVFQLFIVYPDNITGVSPTTSAGEATRAGLEKYPVCGFIYALDNLVTQEQAAEMVAGQQSFSKIPLLTCLDEEGGIVYRLMNRLGTTRLGPMFSYKDLGTPTAYENASTIARDISSLGFNTDFAPVADVWTNPANNVIGNRAYSDDFNQAAELVASAVRGFKYNNVICSLKHFPGHGDTLEDSHYSGAVVRRTLEQLRQGEFLPFVSGIEAGADMVMVGHLTVEELGPTPAGFSHEIVTGLLREELGFEGVVITDALSMSAATKFAGDGELCVLALEAGCDLLLAPDDLQAGAQAIFEALDSGRLSWERIDESLTRILMMKLGHGLME